MVEHDEAGSRFVIRLEDGGEAVLSYSKRGEVLNYYHVFVPQSRRGHGIAGRLTRHAFDYARQHNLRVIPTCPFIKGEFLVRFPQYQDVVEQTP